MFHFNHRTDDKKQINRLLKELKRMFEERTEGKYEVSLKRSVK